MLVHGRPHALALRSALIREHLGSGAPDNPDDFDAVFRSFIEVASKNDMPRDNKPLTGQVVFHRLYEH